MKKKLFQNTIIFCISLLIQGQFIHHALSQEATHQAFGLSPGKNREIFVGSDKIVVGFDLEESKQKTHAYFEDENAQFFVTSDTPGYVYLVNVQSATDACHFTVLFPNPDDRNNYIGRGRTMTIPTNQEDLGIIVMPPFGREELIAIVSETALPPEVFNMRSFDASLVKVDGFDTIRQQIHAQSHGKWGSNFNYVMTHPKDAILPSSMQYAVYIGVGKYAINDISELPAAANVNRFKKVMNEHAGFGVDEKGRTIVLTDEQATLEKIRGALTQLRTKTKAGDTIAIYWNGHGHRMTATEALHSPDGQRGYLIPYDAKTVAGSSDLPDPKTMMSDLEFGQLVRDINDRKIFIFIDACFAGTFVEAPQVVAQSVFQRPTAQAKIEDGVNFFGPTIAKLGNTRSVYKEDAVVICASQRDEVSWAIGNSAIATKVFCDILESKSGPLSVERIFFDLSLTVTDELTKKQTTNPEITIQRPVLQGKADTFILKP